MVGKLTRMPAATQQALQRLACLGNVAETTMLSTVLGAPADQVHAAMWEAVRQELVERRDGSYMFNHDRVREAAYSLSPKDQLAADHLRIGRLLVVHTPPEQREEAIFGIVNQLNRGATLITAREEREQLAELNLMAGKRAKRSTAYASALTYLTAGAALLPDDCWERRRQLIFELELQRAECEFISGNFDHADQLIADLLYNTTSRIDRAAAYHLKVRLHILKSENRQAIDNALTCLQLFGIDVPAHPTWEQVQAEYETIWRNLDGRPLECLIDLPLMIAPEQRAATQMLSIPSEAAYHVDFHLFCFLLCRLVNFSV